MKDDNARQAIRVLADVLHEMVEGFNNHDISENGIIRNINYAMSLINEQKEGEKI